jgi:hypothetical protein
MSHNSPRKPRCYERAAGKLFSTIHLLPSLFFSFLGEAKNAKQRTAK